MYGINPEDATPYTYVINASSKGVEEVLSETLVYCG